MYGRPALWIILKYPHNFVTLKEIILLQLNKNLMQVKMLKYSLIPKAVMFEIYNTR